MHFYFRIRVQERSAMQTGTRKMRLGMPHLPYRTVTDRETLEREIYPDMRKHYYWSENFSAAYYIAQAKAGFIAITEEDKEGPLLLPEIQFAYALLDFEMLHISRKVRRLLKKREITLKRECTLDAVASAIGKKHKQNWLTPRYLQTLKATEGIDESFQPLAFSIREGDRLIAGEIGYKIGKTYTSLSGFSRQEREYNHYGTAQLVLLAHYLQAEGYAFWNLGQPYMPYKFALGARTYSRADFLARWQEATAP